MLLFPSPLFPRIDTRARWRFGWLRCGCVLCRKSRFRTWVTSAGRPIVEQMVDWFIFSLHEALQQENLGLELSETAKAG